ncbi:hypothetical protein PLGE761_02580 [Pluralibacter gergoviae]
MLAFIKIDSSTNAIDIAQKALDMDSRSEIKINKNIISDLFLDLSFDRNFDVVKKRTNGMTQSNGICILAIYEMEVV